MACPKQLSQYLLLLLLYIVNGQNDNITETFEEFYQSILAIEEQINSMQTAFDWFSESANSTLPLEIRLPNCKDVTLKSSDFSIRGGTLVLKKNGSTINYTNYRRAEDKKTANVCYFLSPQLHNCNLTRLNRRLYVYDESLLALRNNKTNSIVALGDFYELPDGKETVSCNESLGYTIGRNSRCEFITLGPKEYKFLNNITSIRLLSNDRIIHQAYMRKRCSSNIRLCFPLSAAMTTCPRHNISSQEYRLDKNHKILILRTRTLLNLGDYKSYPKSGIVSYCQDEENSTTSNIYTQRYYAYYYSYITQLISAVFIIVAVVLHVLYPSINYHAKPLICQMLSMAVWFFAGSYSFLWYPETTAGCYVLFVFYYFSALTSLFWLNVLAFDLWSIFANLQTSSMRLCANICDKKPKFLLYCVYAYCIPLMMTILSLVLETHPSMQEVLGLQPDISALCWFWDAKSLCLFYSAPAFYLLFCNMVFFGLTVHNLRRASEGVAMVNKKRNKQLFIVCVKIFVTMGLFWIIELVALLIDGRIEISILAITSRSFQGILLFIIYICKPSTIRKLRRKVAGTILSKKQKQKYPNSPKGNAPFSISSTEHITESGISSENTTKEEIPESNIPEHGVQLTY